MLLQDAIAILEIVIPIFVHNQVEDAEIDEFLAALAQAATQGGSGTIPAFKAGNIWFGPIPFGPTQPGAAIVKS